MLMNKSRMTLLSNAWQKEWGKMLSTISKQKKPSKKLKELKEAIENISDESKDRVLHAYHEKCKMHHALIFF